MSPAPALLAGNAFYYYEDLAAAVRFYTETLGFELAADFGYAGIVRIAANAFLTLVDSAHGMHRADEPKSVTLALVTDQLEAWYAHLKNQNADFEKDIRVRPGSAHDGFVIRDPEGYFLEFERFNPHPENELLIPLLAAVSPAPVARPELAVQATVTWLYYNDVPEAQIFYEGLLAKPLLVDQGWAKVYPVAGASFIGLVDGAKGLHRATEKKCVTISFITEEIDAWLAHVQDRPGFRLKNEAFIEEAGRVQLFVGLDPGGYQLEWDRFLPVPENEKLFSLLVR